MKRQLVMVALLGAALPYATSALASYPAWALIDVNMRQGPGPDYPVVQVIAATLPTTIEGCIVGSKWCFVSSPGNGGWVYADYLTTGISGHSVVMSDAIATLGLATIPMPAAAPQPAQAAVAPAKAPIDYNPPGQGEVFCFQTCRDAKDDAQCQAIGALPGSPAYAECRIVKGQQRAEFNRAQSAAIAQGLAAASAIYSATHPAPPPPPPIPPTIYCTTTRAGNQLNTTCR